MMIHHLEALSYTVGIKSGWDDRCKGKEATPHFHRSFLCLITLFMHISFSFFKKSIDAKFNPNSQGFVFPPEKKSVKRNQ
jgi:hypothetical protein